MTALLIILWALSPVLIFGVCLALTVPIVFIIDTVAGWFGRDPFSFGTSTQTGGGPDG